MSALREALAAQLARYDDEAFAALANKGLLRRALKDLEKAPVTAADVVEEGDAVVVAALGQRVRFDARGPAQARCSCPATSPCQHLLAAAIGLQRLWSASGVEAAVPEPAAVPEGPAAPASTTEPPPPTSSTPTPELSGHADLQPLRDTLLDLPHETLLRHAGKPGYRWAWQFVQDLSVEREFRDHGERHLALSFVRPRVTFRFMGGGLDGLMADVALPHLERYQVAAVLALRVAHGHALIAPEPTRRGAQTALDLGKDHAIAPVTATERDEARSRLRASVRQLLGEGMRLGLSHLSPAVGERLATLAVWAQGTDYPRLSLLLRRLADHVELLLARVAGADERRLMDDMALVLGLIDALETQAARGASPAALVGRSRSRYERAGAMELLGLGASAWSSASGYVGLTMVFWSAEEGVFLSCSEARPATLRGFDPVARYHAGGPWTGLGTPASATGRRVMLLAAETNDKGRLSLSERTSAQVAPDADRLIDTLPVADDWDPLLSAYAARRRSLLAEPDPMADWVVVRPAEAGAARFDTRRQTLLWSLLDAQQRALRAEVFFTPQTEAVIHRIEKLGPLEPGTLVVGRLRPGESGPVLEPLSLVTPRAGANGSRVDALAFDPAPGPVGETSNAEPTAASSLRTTATSTSTSAMPTPHGPVLPTILMELRHWLYREAERGVSQAQEPRWRQEATQWGERALQAGLSAFPAALASAGDAATALLRWHYLLLQYERLAGASPDEPEV